MVINSSSDYYTISPAVLIPRARVLFVPQLHELNFSTTASYHLTDSFALSFAVPVERDFHSPNLLVGSMASICAEQETSGDNIAVLVS